MSDIIKRKAGGQFAAGRPSAKKRKKAGARQVAELIQKESEGGAELVKYLFDTFRGVNFADDSLRKWACEQLLDRGFGRAPQVIDVNIEHSEAQQGPTPDQLAYATDDELEALEQAQAVLLKLQSGIIDV
jgi:hypothetical protein